MKDDFSADIKTTGRLTLGVYSIGNIETSGDVDWFKLSLTRGQHLIVNLEGSPTNKGSLSDTYLRGVYDSMGNYIDGTSNDDSNGFNSRVVFSPTETGDYYIAASGLGSNIGTYGLIVNEYTPPEDDFSADTNTTGHLILNGSTTGTLAYQDSDWFAISLKAGQDVRFNLIPNQYSVTLQDATGAVLSTNSDNYGNYYSVLATGQYYVSVTDSWGDSNLIINPSSYTLIAIQQGDARDNRNLFGTSLNDVITGQGGDDVIYGLAGDDTLDGGNQNDKLLGSDGNDSLYGGSGNDKLVGGDGDDTLYGGSDNDILNGGNGNDVLNGEQGVNVLRGDAGNDIFQLTTAYNLNKILDFSATEDTIQLSNSVFGSLIGEESNSTLSTDKFIAGKNVTTSADGNDYLIYDSATGALYYDADANGMDIDPVKIAILGTTTHPMLTVDDFVVI